MVHRLVTYPKTNCGNSAESLQLCKWPKFTSPSVDRRFTCFMMKHGPTKWTNKSRQETPTVWGSGRIMFDDVDGVDHVDDDDDDDDV